MGCIARLGCLFVLVVAGAAAYLTRDRWLDRIPGRTAPVDTTTRTAPTGPGTVVRGGAKSSTGGATLPSTATADPSGWTPLTQAGANRTRDALQKLNSPRGPALVTLAGSDVASYVFLQIARQMPAGTDSFAARVDEDRIRLRARMKTSELGGAVSGVLGALLGDRERVEMGGTLRVIGRGEAEFRVLEVRVKDVGLPDALVSRLVRSVVRGPRPAGLHENGLPIAIPSYIGDVRVSNGRITLYKNVQ
jgi:hypothetical protein